MCTTIRRAINWNIEHCDKTPNPRCAEARRNGNLKKNKMAYLENDNYDTVLLLRDPFERAISAYRNSNQNPHIYTKNCRNTTECTFDEWVEDLIHDPRNSNEHFVPQHKIAQFDSGIRYKYRLRMSSLTDLDFFFRDLLGFPDGAPKENANKSRPKPLQPQSQLGDEQRHLGDEQRQEYSWKPNQKTLDRLARFYARDLKLWQQSLDYGTPRLPGDEVTLYDHYISSSPPSQQHESNNTKY